MTFVKKESHSQIMNFMKKSKKAEKLQSQKIEIKNNFFFYYTGKLEAQKQLYYKFPFNDSIQNDRSELFLILYKEFRKALLGISANYKKFGYCFYILYRGETILFENICRLSRKLKSICDENGITYEDMDEYLLLKDTDIFLFIDYILNEPIYENSKIPFIISHHMFTNGIVYKTEWKVDRGIRSKNIVKYKYFIGGFFINVDFKCLINIQ